MLEWHNEKRKVKDLIPSDYNPRYLTEKDRYDLEQSITKFNEVEPVVINIGSRNNILIGGHQRLIIYADLGKEEIDLNEILNKQISSENIYNDLMLYFDIWLIPRDSQYDHPTQKPISLHEKPLKRCSKVGDIVLDLFGGSGSTLLACEQMGRKCFMMENDPLFCQTIVNRFNQSKQII